MDDRNTLEVRRSTLRRSRKPSKILTHEHVEFIFIVLGLCLIKKNIYIRTVFLMGNIDFSSYVLLITNTLLMREDVRLVLGCLRLFLL